MTDQKLKSKDQKLVESTRYLQSEYQKVKPLAEKENRPATEILDTTLTLGLEARVNHPQIYKEMLEKISENQVQNKDLENLEHVLCENLAEVLSALKDRGSQ